jgi:hypothetical protein
MIVAYCLSILRLSDLRARFKCHHVQYCYPLQLYQKTQATQKLVCCSIPCLTVLCKVDVHVRVNVMLLIPYSCTGTGTGTGCD